MKSPAVTRVQLRSTFLHLWHPQATADDPGSRFGLWFFTCLLQELFQPYDHAMCAALDAGCLAEIGTTFKDNRLLHEAQRSHLLALRLFRAALRDGLPRGNEHSAMCVMTALIMCGRYTALSDDCSAGLLSHLRTVCGLLKKTSDAELSEAWGEKQDLSKFRPYQTFALPCGLLWRKALISPEQKPPRSDLGGMLDRITLRLPGLLERVEELLQKRSSADRIILVATISELRDLESSLLDWVTKWYRSITGSPYWTTTAPAEYGDVFRKAFVFPAYTSASLHTTFWVCLLELRQAVEGVKTLLKTTRRHEDCTLATQSGHLRKSIIEAADNCCMSIMGRARPEYGAHSYMAARENLMYVYRCYRRPGDDKKME